jgi:glycerol-3-phosphate acyltransferase PlsY
MDVGIPESTAIGLLVIVIAILLATVFGAFLIGSIPFGYIVGRIFYHTDIRRQGSGNIGAMNALRTLGRGGAIVVLLLDALKGFVPTLSAMLFFRGVLDTEGFPPTDQIMGALVAGAAVLGHCFSPWLRFKGGKGVATSFGAIFALCWPAGLVSVLAPFAIYGFTRSVPETLYGVFAALLVIFTHRENIARLRSGTEGPIRLLKPHA